MRRESGVIGVDKGLLELDCGFTAAAAAAAPQSNASPGVAKVQIIDLDTLGNSAVDSAAKSWRILNAYWQWGKNLHECVRDDSPKSSGPKPVARPVAVLEAFVDIRLVEDLSCLVYPQTSSTWARPGLSLPKVQ